MIVQLPSSIRQEPCYPTGRPFTEFEALIDLLLTGPTVLSMDPYELSQRWWWDYGQAKNFMKDNKHFFKDASMFVQGEIVAPVITAQMVVDIFNRVFDRNSQMTDSRKRLIMGRIREGRKMKPPIGIEQFKAVFEFKKKQWNGTEFEKFLRISTLCAPSKFIEYLEEAREDFKKSKFKTKAENEGVVLQAALFK